MKNNIKYFGLLGLLGLLGIITKNYVFFVFFGFFGFFGVSVKSDERFYVNIYKSGFYAFIVGLIGISLLMITLISKFKIALIAILAAIIFVAMLFTFIGCFHWLDRRGN